MASRNALSLTRIRSTAAMQTLYDGAAKSWQGGIEKLGFPAAYDDLIRAANPPTGGRVLDAGCGSGALAEVFLNRTGHAGPLDLLDLSPQMLAVAGARLPGARLIEGAVGDETAADTDYDVVLCAHVIEHTPDPQASLRWLHNRLRPGGMLILAVSRPHWCTTLVRWRWGHQSFAPNRMVGMLKAAGFAKAQHRHFPSGPPFRVSCG